MYLFKIFDCGCVYRIQYKANDPPTNLTLEGCCQECYNGENIGLTVKRFTQYANMTDKKARFEEYTKGEGFVKMTEVEIPEDFQKRAQYFMDVLNVL